MPAQWLFSGGRMMTRAMLLATILSCTCEPKIGYLTTSSNSQIHRFRARNGQYLGYVFAAPGLRRRTSISINPKSTGNHDTCLDWALVKVMDERIGPNILGEGDKSGQLRLASAEVVKELTDEELYIYGRTSGHSKGPYGGPRPAMVSEDNINGKKVFIETIEHSITQTGDKPFFPQGDSGAIVYLENYAMAGLLFAGGLQTKLPFFTHIDDLFSDITRVTRADGIRLLP
ncbi:hypothetical protein BDW62DRAFT_28155 [Aspergillus aurantiobrunneus]